MAGARRRKAEPKGKKPSNDEQLNEEIQKVVSSKDDIYLDSVAGIDPEIVGGEDHTSGADNGQGTVDVNGPEGADANDNVNVNVNDVDVNVDVGVGVDGTGNGANQQNDFSVLAHDSHGHHSGAGTSAAEQFAASYTNSANAAAEDAALLAARYQAQQYASQFGQHAGATTSAEDAAAAAAAATSYMQLASAAQQSPANIEADTKPYINSNGTSSNGHPPHNMVSFMSTERLSNASNVGKRRVRLGWSKQETEYLMEGCKVHGVGNWKKILTDPNFQFNCRTAVDLKDRFRTSFPEEYGRLYPNAKTHKVKRNRNSNNSGIAEMTGIDGEYKSDSPLGGSGLVKINRKERRSFTKEEDERLLEGFNRHGPAWSKIQRDSSLQFYERRSTDLRDRFRNAFPDKYTQAGYKGRAGDGTGTRKGGNSASSNNASSTASHNAAANASAVAVANAAAAALPILHEETANAGASAEAQLLNQRYNLQQPANIMMQHGNQGQNFNPNFQNAMYYPQASGLQAGIPQLYRGSNGSQGSN
ncbi:Myb family protein (predicted) [Sugiyamaella lignohabitans]|uniref:Myb family protein (Predicted) n=1 Tax=Sugiyamaella lignohabitans TaxID=796027 RepID=A0A167CBF4_9ASCO|nr:Myb family protein (predicted) [Sugiyamaella lignohabitans]ANB11465.1 Myb family protein (predicted) [Sugiyamaella lignohabitans]